MSTNSGSNQQIPWPVQVYNDLYVTYRNAGFDNYFAEKLARQDWEMFFGDPNGG